MAMVNKRAVVNGNSIVLYCNGKPFLNTVGDPTVAFPVTINAQNLFTFVGNPNAASTTSVYKCWFLDEPPDNRENWSIMLAGTEKPCQFIKYEPKDGMYIVYFKHTN